MKFKKIAAIFAATALTCFGTFSSVSAEDSEETTEEITVITEETLSEDSLWNYKLLKDNTTGEEYASLESYCGTDTEVVIPSEVDGNIVRQLGDYTFYENTTITKITIPETLTDFGNFPFFACSSLKEFEVDEKNEIYTIKDGILMGDEEQLLICYPPAKPETEYAIPDGVIALNPAAFATCINLTSITFPDTLERMGLYCFAECTSLNNVIIPENVSELSQFNFTGCTSLTNITLPDTLHTIGDGAFFSCTALNSIEFPDYIQEIGQCAFVSTGFTEIEIPSTVQAIGYSAFGYTADQQGQLVAMSSFTLKGLTGSMAQSYCGENEHVTFEATDEITTEETTEKAKDETELKTGVIIAICGGGIVIIAAVIIIIVRTKKSKNNSEADEDESDDSYDTDTYDLNDDISEVNNESEDLTYDNETEE